MLIVRTVTASSSSATVVSDIWKFYEKNVEMKIVQFSLLSKQLIFHEGTMNLCDHLLKVNPLCYKKSESEAKAKVKQ